MSNVVTLINRQEMPLASALETIIIDGRYCVEHVAGELVVWNADTGEEAACLAITDHGGKRFVNTVSVRFLTAYHG